MGSMESEQPTQRMSMSEDESMRLFSEVSEEAHQAAEGEGSASGGAPRRSDEENSDEFSVVDDASEAASDNDDATPLEGSDHHGKPVTSGSASGYEGRARRGVSKPGGYDETPKRRGSRKKMGVRIRYVDDDERGGGTTEQGIRMGPVSVWRVAHGHRSEVGGAATPLRDPG